MSLFFMSCVWIPSGQAPYIYLASESIRKVQTQANAK